MPESRPPKTPAPNLSTAGRGEIAVLLLIMVVLAGSAAALALFA